MAQVVLENIVKRFDSTTVVKNVNLTIADREFVVLVGPSGCGKTTSLRMVAGLEEITEGKILIDNKVVNEVPPKDRDVAMVFQNYALYPHMTVYDNMAFGLKIRKVPKPEIAQRVKEAAEILDLTEYLGRQPKQLSGGQRQRVALGRAIVRKPKVFLMDEPLSNLDAKLRVQMRAELKKLHSRLQATIIYVTHDQVEAMTLGDRIVVMYKGEVQQADRPMAIYQRPANRFVGGFIGSPPMNFINGELVQQNGEIRFASQDISLSIPNDFQEYVRHMVGKKVILGIRPADIYESPAANGDSNEIQCKVDFRELMGSETYLYLHVGGTPLIARATASNDVLPDTSLSLHVNIRCIHFYDPETQQALL